MRLITSSVCTLLPGARAEQIMPQRGNDDDTSDKGGDSAHPPPQSQCSTLQIYKIGNCPSPYCGLWGQW